jgi:uridine kinase
VRVSLDFFERPPAERHARGELSPEGYYLDSFDVDRLHAHVLSIGGPPELVVVVDGIFLQRPELADLWDATVWVEADLDQAAERALERDLVRIDSVDAELERYRLRYLPAQRRYIEEQRPQDRATFVLRNGWLDEPELVVGRVWRKPG